MGTLTAARQPAAANRLDSALIDAHGRRLRKLRVSITQACNYRCLYCMAPDHANPVEDGLLSPGEIGALVGSLVELGVDAVRLTGGEPLLRRDVGAILDALSDVPVRKGITTNGQFLSNHAARIVGAGFASVNVSLDSLDPVNFRRLARGGELSRVLDGIDACLVEGLEVKVNCVAMRGLNDHEIEAFHAFAVERGVEVRFLELMKIGPGRALHAAHFLPAGEIKARLEALVGPLWDVPTAIDSTAFLVESLHGARIGFVASESRPFCGNCSRLRLSATGMLHPCLFKEDCIDLRGADRDGIRERVKAVAALKPTERITEVARPMHAIGG
ncbi:MAG: 3,8-cyclase MoaA [Fibrobacterota bacterium]|jgi:cyclic pyranopterin phosphate synthase